MKGINEKKMLAKFVTKVLKHAVDQLKEEFFTWGNSLCALLNLSDGPTERRLQINIPPLPQRGHNKYLHQSINIQLNMQATKRYGF